MRVSNLLEYEIACYLVYCPKNRVIQLKPTCKPSGHFTIFHGKKDQTSIDEMHRVYTKIEALLRGEFDNQCYFHPCIRCKNSTYGRFTLELERLLHELRGDCADDLPGEKRPHSDIVAWESVPLAFHTSHSSHVDKGLCAALNNLHSIHITIVPKPQ